jgi:N-acyl-D-amino-acid deacylase
MAHLFTVCAGPKDASAGKHARSRIIYGRATDVPYRPRSPERRLILKPDRIARVAVTLCLTVEAACAAAVPRQPEVPARTLIVNARVLDGSGSPARAASVRIVGDRIVEVGALRAAPGDRVVDAGGLALAPGFIDTHSHHDRGLLEQRDALAVVSQGVTTIVAGQDGGSRTPLAQFFARLERTPPAVNVASYVGHGTVRSTVMGDDFRRAATPAEVGRMREIVEAEMRAGALGLSTGLEYDPGIYSSRGEVLELARAVAPFSGRYISHVRSEDRAFWQAIDEVIAIGRDARIPVQVSHLKLAMRSLWGQTDSLFRMLDRARAAGVDVTADVYPYTYWQSTLTVLFPERDFANRAAAEFALREVSAPEGLLLSGFAPNTTYVGKTVADIARLRGTDAATTLMALIRETAEAERAGRPSDESVIGTSMAEGDVARLIAWPHANICSDGELEGRHPRGFGAFPRVLGRYVREQGVVSLSEAVRKMTSLGAAHVGIRERGRIAPGYFADLVMFDPNTVIDRATPTAPRETAVGIRTVWVNGEVVYERGTPTGRHPGRVVRRAEAR